VAVRLLCFNRTSPELIRRVHMRTRTRPQPASNIETRLSAIQPSRFLEVAPENGLIAGIGRLITLSLTFCQFEGRNWFFERQVALTTAACRRRRVAPSPSPTGEGSDLRLRLTLFAAEAAEEGDDQAPRHHQHCDADYAEADAGQDSGRAQDGKFT
jgi:hypothetical protein